MLVSVKVFPAESALTKLVSGLCVATSEYEGRNVLELGSHGEQSGEIALVRIDVAIKLNRFQYWVVFNILKELVNSSADFPFRKIAVEEHACGNDGFVVTMTVGAI